MTSKLLTLVGFILLGLAVFLWVRTVRSENASYKEGCWLVSTYTTLGKTIETAVVPGAYRMSVQGPALVWTGSGLFGARIMHVTTLLAEVRYLENPSLCAEMEERSRPRSDP